MDSTECRPDWRRPKAKRSSWLRESRPHRRRSKVTMLPVLVAACAHEFAWQMMPIGTQGATRDVTQWALICSLCWAVHRLARQRFASAVCAAVAVMSSTTAGCAGWWLGARFAIVPGQDGCSAQWGVPMLMISAIAALAVFFWWPHETRQH